MSISPLHKARLSYKPVLPAVLSGSAKTIALKPGKETGAEGNVRELRALFPKTFGQPVLSAQKTTSKISAAAKGQKPVSAARRVGVILSGGPAAGGHNVIAGLFDALKNANASSQLIGFLGGPGGLVDNKKILITKALVDAYRNTGGFDIIGSGRTKIETPAQFQSALETAKKNKLDAVVVIGGDDSNTNAALLAEYFLTKGNSTQVIGVPKTIDGDLKNKYIETSFGFDTAVKTYSELIGNIARDANSAKKYWHFIRLMGRSASHITLECALQTQPNVALISEEVQKKRQSLNDIVNHIADAVAARAAKKEDFGVVLVPEGLIEFIPEINALIDKLNDVLSRVPAEADLMRKTVTVASALPAGLRATFDSLPATIREQLLLDRDSHGNVQVSLIETERLLMDMVKKELGDRKKAGRYVGKFAAQNHFFGYEARCAFPSNFDAAYCYALGANAFILIANGKTGYLSSVQNLTAPPKNWKAGGIPLTMMMNIEKRHGHDKPVIRKALVTLDGAPFKQFAARRKAWQLATSFRYPGALQYEGAADIADAATITLQLEQGYTPKKAPAKTTAKKPAKSAAKSATKSTKKSTAKKGAVKSTAKKTAKATAKKTPVKKAVKAAPVKKTAKKPVKNTVKKSAVKKAPAKKTVKKAVKAAAKKPISKTARKPLASAARKK